MVVSDAAAPALTAPRIACTDRLGLVMAVTRSTGAVTERLAYNAFGMSNASSAGYPYRYTGQRIDPEAGLRFYKARVYSTTLGRFLQTDPIGTKDDLHLYAYVGNDPVNKTDPSGMRASDYCAICESSYASWFTGQRGFPDAAQQDYATALQNHPIAGDFISAADGARVEDDFKLYASSASIALSVVPIIPGPGKPFVRGGAAAVRAGQFAEALVRAAEEIGSKTKIVIGSRTRIPDGLSREYLTEIKNVRQLSLTQQLRDFEEYSTQAGLNFRLYVPEDSRLSRPLLKKVDEGCIILCYLPRP